MTESNYIASILAALLRDVPIQGRANTDGTGLHELVFLKDVLAALTLPDMDEAGKVVKRLRKIEEAGHVRHLSKADRLYAADMIAALLAQIAALTELLREARTDLEAYITHEYPKDQHPYYERQWNRDMELCRRIDAAITEETHDR
jgi:hypothetical protein